MSEYTELMNALNTAHKVPCNDLECPGSKDCPAIGCLLREAADELKRLRNELCLRCGAYHNAHLGACDGCRWRG